VLRMDAAASDLIRVGDASMASRSGEFRAALDGHDADNSAPMMAPQPQDLIMEAGRLGELVVEVEDFRLSNPSDRGTKAATSETSKASAPQPAAKNGTKRKSQAAS